MQRAGSGKRVAAFLIDFVIVFLAKSLIFQGAKNPILMAVIFTVYTAFMESSKYRGTLGKMAMGLEVSHAGEGPIPLKTAFLRAVIRAVSVPNNVLFFIPFLVSSYFVFFTEDKLALHDRAAKTRVCASEE